MVQFWFPAQELKNFSLPYIEWLMLKYHIQWLYMVPYPMRKLTIYFHLVLKLKIQWDLTLFPICLHTVLWHGQKNDTKSCVKLNVLSENSPGFWCWVEKLQNLYHLNMNWEGLQVYSTCSLKKDDHQMIWPVRMEHRKPSLITKQTMKTTQFYTLNSLTKCSMCFYDRSQI